ncbi:MAG: TonB-dependent receptor plug domain-containing protein, partial [Rhodothermales bacterium]|nr:TonB-dependent receptor plug domain-containing protein [Rhodothermales bacterium]
MTLLFVLAASVTPNSGAAEPGAAIPDEIYGKIAGTVVDGATGEPLPGVNVFIDGTTQGAATNADGEYVILRVRPGTYAVKATFIGFATSIVEGIVVVVDQTSRVDFSLREEVFEGEEVVVTAEREIVEMDRTTTTAVVDADQLQALPLTGINDAINLQAGVVDGRFRGGRSGEVSYLVNGVPINNAYNNQAAFEIEQNMVSNLQVISGVFNAEYGQAQSGVVNIVTKDVPDEWSGNVLAYAGTLVSNRKMEFVNRTSGPGTNLSIADFESREYTISEITPLHNLSDLQFSFGGPLLRDRLGVQLTARRLVDKGHLVGRELFMPADSSEGLTTGRDPESWEIESTGDGDFVSMNTNERVSVNLGLNGRLTRTLQLEYNLFWQ